MAELLVGRVHEFDDDHRKIVNVNGRDVVVFQHNGRFYALENTCLHMGGPVGEGLLLGKVEAVLTEDKRWLGDRFSEEEIHIVCPWHGWEYDIETGRCAGDRRRRLGRYETAQRGEDVYVIV